MENKLEFIENYQLMYYKYDIETLEYNIDRLSLRKLLVTQKLTPEFCKLYLLNPEEQAMCIEDHYISIKDILIYQKHIKKEDLINYN